MIEYHSDIQRITPDHLCGFFEDWPNPPSPDLHLRLLAESSHFVVAACNAPARKVTGGESRGVHG